MVSQRPFVSVIIPTYNHVHFLSEAINSAIDQTYPNVEIIVVDDGSTDNTAEIVAAFGDKVHYIWQENSGLSAARNTGILAAGGDIISLLDADDLYEPDFISTLATVLQVNKEIDGVYCQAQTVDEDSLPLPQVIGKVVDPDHLQSALLKGGFFPPLCMFAYKYCYEDLGLFDKAFQGAADWDMWLRMSANYRIIGMDKVLAKYRVVQNSMSHDPTHMLDDRTRVLRKHFSGESSSKSLWTPMYRRAMAENYFRATIEYLQLGDNNRAYQYFYESITCDHELISKYDVLYRLGLGAQPMGFRGNYTSLDVRASTQLVFSWLDRLFKNHKLTSLIEGKREASYATAYWALGALSYGKREFKESRRYLLQAVIAYPRNLFNTQLLKTFAKSLMPMLLVDWYRSRRLAASDS